MIFLPHYMWAENKKKRNKDYDFSPLLYVGGTQKKRNTDYDFPPHYMWAENNNHLAAANVSPLTNEAICRGRRGFDSFI